MVDKLDLRPNQKTVVMMSKSKPEQVFAITASTCFLALSGLVTIRDNDDGLYDDEAVAFADYLIQIILAQPATVLAMEASEPDEIGQTLIHNCEAWLS